MTGDARPVPHVLHQIWLQGPDAMRGEIRLLVKQAERAALAAGWSYRLWSDADLLALPEYAAARKLPPTFMHLSDLGRYCILWREGGLYVDADTEVCRMPNDTGPNGPFVGAWVMEGNNAAMAAPAGHSYIGRVLTRALRPEAWEGENAQVNLCMVEAEVGDVRKWEPQWWHGNWRWRYGNHLMQHLALGSAIPLGDTFPPGATI